MGEIFISSQQEVVAFKDIIRIHAEPLMKNTFVIKIDVRTERFPWQISTELKYSFVPAAIGDYEEKKKLFEADYSRLCDEYEQWLKNFKSQGESKPMYSF